MTPNPPPVPDDAMTPLAALNAEGGWGAVLAAVSCRRVRGLSVLRLSDLALRAEGLTNFIAMMQVNGVQFRSIDDGLDTRATGYDPLLACARALVEAERARHRDAANRGLATATAKGLRPGRPPYLDAVKEQRAAQLLRAGRSARYVRDKLHLSHAAVARVARDLKGPQT